MKIGLFIPCYIDQFYPNAGIASLRLLQKLGLDVEYPMEQTCCGQPIANSGYEHKAAKLHENYYRSFKKFDYVVMPSGSCALHVKEHMPELKSSGDGQKLADNTWEIISFIHDVLGSPVINATFPHKVGLHIGCHGLRGLRIAKSSETKEKSYSKVEAVLSNVQGLDIVRPSRPDECCGFGGTFSVFEEPISVQMGIDKLESFLDQGAEIIASTDISCLMHQEGIAKRKKMNVRFMHISEILMNNEA